MHYSIKYIVFLQITTICYGTLLNKKYIVKDTIDSNPASMVFISHHYINSICNIDCISQNFHFEIIILIYKV